MNGPYQPLSEDRVLELLGEVDAVITGSHIIYTSGKHGSAYINKDALYPHTRKTSWVCHELARRFENDNIEVVVAPAVGGVILSQWVSHHLETLTGRSVLAVYAEKSEDGASFVIKRGYDKLIKGKRALVVEDVANTGGSARKTVDATRLYADVIGVGVLCNRGGITANHLGDVPKFEALVNVKLDMWEAMRCPLCLSDIPINTDVGKGREYLARTRK